MACWHAIYITFTKWSCHIVETLYNTVKCPSHWQWYTGFILFMSSESHNLLALLLSFFSTISYQLHIDSLLQYCSNSSASMELLQSYIRLLIWWRKLITYHFSVTTKPTNSLLGWLVTFVIHHSGMILEMVSKCDDIMTWKYYPVNFLGESTGGFLSQITRKLKL